MTSILASIAGIGLLAQAPDPETVAKLAEQVELFSAWKLGLVAVIVTASVAASRLTAKVLDRLGEGNARRRLFMKKTASFVRIGIFIIGAYLIIVTIFDFEKDQTALLGLGGTLAVAFGFALKDISSSIVAGVMILFDQPFQVGDRVQFEDTYGEVMEIGLRTVRIKTLDDSQVSIPNNKFLTEAVSSANAGALDMLVQMDFYVDLTEDFQLAKRLLYEACTTSKYVYLEKPVRVMVEENVTNFAFCTRLRCKAYVIDARYEKSFVTDVTERAKAAFRAHDIKYPYAREFHAGERPDDDHMEVTPEQRRGLASPPAGDAFPAD